MYVLIIGKISSLFGWCVGRARNLDTKHKIMIAFPFGLIGTYLATLFF